MISLSIRHEADRPREKLLSCGVASLSDTELLAAFLGTGRAGRCAYTVASDLLTHFGSLRAVITAPQQAFVEVPGVGTVRYVQLQSALEIIRRHLAEPLYRQPVFHAAETVTEYLRAELRDCPQEKFGILFLDSQHQLIRFKTLFTGTVNSAAVYPRELVREVIASNAAAIILVHNHPSGIPEPSEADIALTREVRAAMGLIDVSVLDHIIVGDTICVSLAQRGLM